MNGNWTGVEIVVLSNIIERDKTTRDFATKDIDTLICLFFFIGKKANAEIHSKKATCEN